MKKKAYTLLELLIVALIVGILAIIALPLFEKTKERGLDREAISNLKLIQAAERIYQMEAGEYLACAGINCINANLKMSLPVGPTGEGQNWNYTITADPTSFGASGERRNVPPSWQRTWSLDHDDEEPGCTGSNCPPP